MNEDWINMVIEDFKETVIFETKYEEGMRCHYQDAVNWLRKILERNQELLHQELQETRTAEQERVVGIAVGMRTLNCQACENGWHNGYNQALTDITEAIRNKELTD